MLRTGIKLLIAALVLHAAYRVGTAYWHHYQFEDAVQRMAQFAERAVTVEDIRQGVLELATAQEIPLDPGALSITREPRRIQVEAGYTRELEVLPGYRYPWQFDVSVAVLTLN